AAVIALNESVQDSNFLGSVALSGVADLRGVYERLDRTNARTLLLVHTAKALTPDVDLHEVLTDQGTSLYGQLEKSCGIPGNSGADLMKTGWENNRWIQKLFADNRLGNVRTSAPLLVIAGESDPVFPVDLVSSTVTRLCHAGDRVQFDRYPGLTLEQVPGETVTEQTSWIRERFAGKPAPGNCH
ncbi:MAG TPA: lipase family protein, partial [Terriglobales bacterium]|nr:lipase family protein [Terriglobales bacterium]